MIKMLTDGFTPRIFTAVVERVLEPSSDENSLLRLVSAT